MVTDLGSAPERSALLGGLKLDPDADPDDELRAGLLDGLYPQHMTTTRHRARGGSDQCRHADRHVSASHQSAQETPAVVCR